MWLLSAAPTASQHTRTAVIPPRIAESIERKKPLPVKESEPEPAKPVMKEATASLSAAIPQPKIRELISPPKQITKRRREKRIESSPLPTAPPVSSAQIVTTARSDFPY